jgi:hypothetical protein
MRKTLYRVQPDEVVAAESPAQLVSYLAGTSMMPVDEQGFRERAAYWMRGLWNREIRTGTDDEFVADMLEAGAYQIEKPR